MAAVLQQQQRPPKNCTTVTTGTIATTTTSSVRVKSNTRYRSVFTAISLLFVILLSLSFIMKTTLSMIHPNRIILLKSTVTKTRARPSPSLAFTTTPITIASKGFFSRTYSTKTLQQQSAFYYSSRLYSSTSTSSSSGSFETKDDEMRNNNNNKKKKKGIVIVLGGTGYLGQNVCKEAITAGYSVISLSRRGIPPSELSDLSKSSSSFVSNIEYRTGDARQPEAIQNILQSIQQSNNTTNDPPIAGIVHCIGLLFDTESGIGSYNQYVSGSGSIPDSNSSYDTITRQTASNAIHCAIQYATNNESRSTESKTKKRLPFIFTSAAEAGWPDVMGGPFIEQIMPNFLKRYLIAKRAVENKLLNEVTTTSVLRPVIVRPSLIYTPNQFASIPPVTFFTIANTIGVPFVDRPVTVSSLAKAIIASIDNDTIEGIQRYPEIDSLSK